MGNGRCHNGRQQQQRHDPNGHQWWWCNGWQDGRDSEMAIAMNGGGSKEGNDGGNKGGRRATATAMKRVMATVMRVAGNKEGNGNSGKSNGNVLCKWEYFGTFLGYLPTIPTSPQCDTFQLVPVSFYNFLGHSTSSSTVEVV